MTLAIRPVKVYLAGQVQHEPDNGRQWREAVQHLYEAEYGDEYVEFTNPLDKYDADADDNELSPRDVVQQDLAMIDLCEALFVRWTNVPSCGTPMEMRYAYERDMPIIVWTPHDRDELSPWLIHHADHVHHESIQALRDIHEIAIDIIDNVHQ